MAVTVTHVVNGPANPNASADCSDVLRWLTCLYIHDDTRVVSGQQGGSGGSYPDGYEIYVEGLYDETGKYPGLLGGDFGLHDWSDAGWNSTLIDFWDNGGLISMSWHAYNPWTGNGLTWTGGDESDRSMNGGDFSDLYTSGNDAYTMWHADMDKKAEWLSDLQDEGVVVLWRPFHEMNGGWFWWGDRDLTKFKKNWIHMFDYFTYEKGLNNLLWVYAPNRKPTAQDPAYYYPGDGYVDIVGLDYYITRWETLADIDDRGGPEMLALGKPFALTEYGPTGFLNQCGPTDEHEPPVDCYEFDTLMDDIRDHCSQTIYFLAWWMNYAIINQLNAQELMDDSWTITRDEVDW